MRIKSLNGGTQQKDCLSSSSTPVRIFRESCLISSQGCHSEALDADDGMARRPGFRIGRLVDAGVKDIQAKVRVVMRQMIR